jgi:tetratricopeptide (TPR) repeat protein
VLISLTVGLSAAIYEARRAERHFQQVRSLANTFVFDVHDSIERLPGATEARRAIVRTALTYLEALRVDAGGDDALALELARAYIKVGDVQGNPIAANLGDTAGAIVSFTRAKELLRPLADGGDRAAQLGIAEAGQKLANIQWAQDDRSGALAELSDAIELMERAVAREPSDREAVSVLGDVYAARARFANTLGDFPAAARDGERAMQAARRLVELDPHNQDHQMNLSTAHNAVGAARILAGNLEGAAAAFREAVALRERLVSERPTDATYQRNLIIAYGNLGDVLGFRTGQNLGDPAGAAAAYEKAVRLAEAATRSDPADQRAIFDLASAKLRLGAALSDVPGQEARGLRVLEEADALNTTLAAQDAGSARYGYNALVIGLRLGTVLTRLGRATEAARRYETVRADATRFLNGPNGANARVQLVLASARLATLRAVEDDARAVPLADYVATELAKKPSGLPVVDAEAYAAAGRSYLRCAMRDTASERDRLARAAIAALTKSAEQWRRAELSKALDAHRTSELAAIDADIAVARKLTA